MTNRVLELLEKHNLYVHNLTRLEAKLINCPVAIAEISDYYIMHNSDIVFIGNNIKSYVNEVEAGREIKMISLLAK